MGAWEGELRREQRQGKKGKGRERERERKKKKRQVSSEQVLARSKSAVSEATVSCLLCPLQWL